MRSILIIAATFLVFSNSLFAQSDFISLDKQTYDYYLKGDFKNLKKTGNRMLSQGIDYYYLRMRMGILAYNNNKYSDAEMHFNKALTFSSGDTISREYIYFSYLFSGRNADAGLYLESVPWVNKSNALKLIKKHRLSEIYVGSSASVFDEVLYPSNSMYFEALKNSFAFNAGLEYYFSSKLKGAFAYTNYRKSGILYTGSNPAGTNLDFSQNQVYAKLTRMTFPGWEFSGFGHIALFSNNLSHQGSRRSSSKLKSEYLGGIGIAKNGWKIRGGANLSFSNFSNSSQLRGEGYLTYLPFGNLNFYITTGGMYQNDKNWGATYQINQEIGIRVAKFFWLESGLVKGNSFLYARNQGVVMNNSFQIPATTIYGNFIFLLGKQLSITLSPFYSQNQDYSWNLTGYTKSNMINSNSFGGDIKLTFKIK